MKEEHPINSVPLPQNQVHRPPFSRLPLSAPNTPPQSTTTTTTTIPIYRRIRRCSSEPPKLTSITQFYSSNTVLFKRTIPHIQPQQKTTPHKTPQKTVTSPSHDLPATPRDEFQIKLYSPSKIPTPKSVKSPSRLSRILQTSARSTKESEEQIQTDKPLIISTISNNKNNVTETENEVPKLTRLSKRLQAMKAASALIQFNSHSNTTPNPTTYNQPQANINPANHSSELVFVEGTAHNRPRARRGETIENNLTSSPTQLTCIKRVPKTEPPESVKLAKLTTRRTNLNKKRFSVIKVEEVVMNSVRPPSPEGKFRKSNKCFKFKSSNNDSLQKKINYLEDVETEDRIEEIRVSLPSTITSPQQCKVTTPPKDDFESTNLREEKQKKRVRWNREVINLEEQYYQRKQKLSPRMPQQDGDDDDNDKSVDEITIERVETPIDPFFNNNNVFLNSHQSNFFAGVEDSFETNSISHPIKPILKMNFISAKERKELEELTMTKSTLILTTSPSSENEGVREREGEYQYELDDFGNLIYNNNEDNVDPNSSIQRPLPSLDLEPVFVKVSRRIWLN